MTASDGEWRVERRSGDPAALHAAEPDLGSAPAVWLLDATTPALVLGSAQRDDVVDAGAVESAGIEVVRRRSGGGAVLVLPGEVLWVDVVVPADHPRWDADVGRAMHWVGEAWAAALGAVGVETTVHRGPLTRTPFSSTVCFAGIGPGEVLGADGRKVVGISQRRRRDLARFQTMLHVGREPGAVVDLLAGDAAWRVEARAAVAAVARAVPTDVDAVVEALVVHLTSSD
ncbi:MAG: lipoyl protein ligase domain-containing protein [Acidimicrobiales bacterium]